MALQWGATLPEDRLDSRALHLRSGAARVWFDEVIEGNLKYPYSGPTSYGGTPYTHPDFCIGCRVGLAGFDYRDVGVVILSEPVPDNVVSAYAVLPDAGLVDPLKNKTALDIVGYGVQEQQQDGRPPYWSGPRVHLYAPSQLISGNFVHSDELIGITLNPGKGKGEICYGDSGGPDLLGVTDVILGAKSYTTNNNCPGVGYSSRIDIQEILDWIDSYSA